MKTSDDVIKEEIDALIADIIAEYEQSGKKVSGNFPKGLKATYSPGKAVLYGFTYLAGRVAGRMPPVQDILRWILARGIRSMNPKITSSGLAWAIATKIKQEGTNPDYHLKIYEKVITPERIDAIIEKVSQFNVNIFIHELTASIQVLAKNK